MSVTGSYIFPSQVYLDEELRERCLASRAMSMYLDLASDTLGMDFRSILRDGTEEEANDPRFRRPLINVIGVAGYHEEQRKRDMHPVCVTGISLGFLSAAASAGWVSLEDMVRMSNTMATVEIEEFEHTDYRSVFFYNCPYEKAQDALRAAGLESRLHLSVIVSSNQFIAGCRESDVPDLKPALVEAGALFKVIPYSYPGHCDLMAGVKKKFIERFRFVDPTCNARIPLVSINDGRPHTSSESIWELSTEQYTTILDWQGVLGYLEGLALDSCVVLEPSDFVLKSMKLDPECGLEPEKGGIV